MQKITAHLKDFLPAEPRNKILIDVLKSSYAKEVLVKNNNTRLKLWHKDLADSFFLKKEAVDWAIGIWGKACGIKIPSILFGYNLPQEDLRLVNLR